MTLGEFINNLALKAGVKPDDKNLVALLSAPSLQQMPVADELATAMDNSLLTIAAATNNHPAVKNVYFAQALNGLDAAQAELMQELGFDDTVKAELLAEKGSIKRANAIAKKAAELAAQKAALEAKPGKTDDTKVQALTNEISQLNQKLAAEIQKQQTLASEYESKLMGVKTQQQLRTMMAQYKTVYDDLPADAKLAAMDALLNNEIQAHQAKWGFSDNGEFTIMRQDGSTLVGENHVAIKPTQFLDKAFSKILKQTDQQQQPAGGTGGQPPFGKSQNQAAPVNAGGAANSALHERLTESLAAYDAATKV